MPSGDASTVFADALPVATIAGSGVVVSSVAEGGTDGACDYTFTILHESHPAPKPSTGPSFRKRVKVMQDRWHWTEKELEDNLPDGVTLPTADRPVLSLEGCEELTEDQQRLLVLRARMLALNRFVRLPLEYDGIEGRDEEPEPVYGEMGQRLNTRDKRIREAVKKEQEDVVSEILGICNADTTVLNMPGKKLECRIMFPNDRWPDWDFRGALLGARGLNHKRLQERTNCRIAIRGMGTKKRNDGAKEFGDDMPMHVLIESWSSESGFRFGIEEVKKLLVPVSIEEKKKQLREVAVLNGTLRTILCKGCGEEGHTLYQCPKREMTWKPADVTCTICGAKTHISQDCNVGTQSHAHRAEADSEYATFMMEITGQDGGVAAASPTVPEAAVPMGQAPSPIMPAHMPPNIFPHLPPTMSPNMPLHPIIPGVAPPHMQHMMPHEMPFGLFRPPPSAHGYGIPFRGAFPGYPPPGMLPMMPPGRPPFYHYAARPPPGLPPR